MYDFHATLHVKPEGPQPSQGPSLRGRELPCLAWNAPLDEPFGLSFEELVARLERLPRMVVEPDGSLLWTGGDPTPWQLEGQISDRSGRVLCVELKGRVAESAFEQLLACLGWPERALAFRLVHEAVLLDEAAFRQYASAGGPGPTESHPAPDR